MYITRNPKQARYSSHPLDFGLPTVAGAVGSGGAAAGAQTLNELQTSLTNSLTESFITTDMTDKEKGAARDKAAGIAKGLISLAVGAAGATTGSTALASNAMTTDANNRQLHPDEQAKASELYSRAKAAGLPYTLEQIKDAMRTAGNKQYGEQAGVMAQIPVDKVSTSTVYDDAKNTDKNWVGNNTNYIQPIQSVDSNLAAFILNGTGGLKSPYYFNKNYITPVYTPAPAKPSIYGNTESEYYAAQLEKRNATVLGMGNAGWALSGPMVTKEDLIRGAGAVQAGGGGLATLATGYGTYATLPLCISVVGCAVPISLGLATIYNADTAATGLKQYNTGKPEQLQLVQPVADITGLSPRTVSLNYNILGISSNLIGGTAASVLPRASTIEPTLSLGAAKGAGKTVDILPTGRQTIDPTETSFSQATVSYQKTGKDYNYDTMVQSMKDNGWDGPPVDVVKMPDGAPTSMDNTRILAAREAGVKVEANVHNASDLLTADEADRFTIKGYAPPKNWGEAIQLRVIKQDGLKDVPTGWPQQFPNGSIYDPKVVK